jgi:hypothetical protein
MQRKYPKCFSTDKDAVLIHDILTKNKIQSLPEVVYLFRLYTLLLCANTAFGNKRIQKADVERRILNFLGIDGRTDPEIPIRILSMLLDKNTEYLASLVGTEDKPFFTRHHDALRARLLGGTQDILSS